jgi:hypothetical protein
MPNKTMKASPPRKGTAAVHVKDANGEHHAVAIWNLSVLIVPDGKFWFAQGLEIDYGAQGSSLEDAKKNFERGLAGTIGKHLQIYGNINNFLKFAPSEILREAAANKQSIKKYKQISLHEILDTDIQKALPFDGIEYRFLQTEQRASA